jgi:hypothetical protein
MKPNLFSLCILSIALAGAAYGQGTVSNAQSGTHYTHSQLNELQRTAHTPDQYKALASYFSTQQKSYLQQAAEEKQEWIRRSQNVMVVAAKYPRPVDSARNLYEYYMYKASEAGNLYGKYNQLSMGATPAQMP